MDMCREHGERICNILFFCSGVLCEGVFVLHSDVCKRFSPESLLYPKSPQGPYRAPLHKCPRLLPVCSETSFVDLGFFILPPRIIFFLLVKPL